MANDPAVSAYGPDEGLPALRDALRRKIREENGLEGVRQAVPHYCTLHHAVLCVTGLLTL